LAFWVYSRRWLVSEDLQSDGFVGWIRPNGRGPWRAVCSAPTDAEAFEKLTGLARQWRFVDLITLPRGERPPERVLGMHRVGA
jgi:hypothetical protein